MNSAGKKYYAAHVRMKSEEAFMSSFYRKYPDAGLNIYFPQRELRERKVGRMYLKLHPVFGGYVFFEISGDDNIINYKEQIGSIKGFYRFLHSNACIAEITGRDLEIILHFIKLKGSIAGVSKVKFDEDDRIVVIDGVLKGLEGNIVKVDRRKGRAKIRLNLYEDSFLIDLSFQAIEAHK
jgi:transcriptional antiterminator NusG